VTEFNEIFFGQRAVSGCLPKKLSLNYVHYCGWDYSNVFPVSLCLHAQHFKLYQKLLAKACNRWMTSLTTYDKSTTLPLGNSCNMRQL